ncbi:MAG: D-amino acid aminotransferase [Gammaproteobacteria bacterium]|nr:D-amino acid aminotransferase [Gammaproteobacteria bacterium]
MADALPVCYLNGQFLPLAEARVSPLDRGFLFGDAVYEVIPVYGDRPLLLDAHLQRLDRSLRELGISNPLQIDAWQELVRDLIDRNGGGDVGIYLQVTRGADTGRDHRFPAGVTPGVFGMASPMPPPPGGIAAITLPDARWGRCDIKATALLANVLARQRAEDAGAQEAILVWDGVVTEGSSSSVLIVEGDDIVRRPNGEEILPGTTTDLIVDLARQAGLTCREEIISVERLRSADEIWITSAMRGIAAIVELDGKPVGSGNPGPVWRQVSAIYEDYKHGPD